MASSSNKNKGKQVVETPQTPFPSTLIIPLGYFIAPKTPTQFVFSPPSIGTVQEVNFNDFLYFAVKEQDNNVVEYEGIHHHTMQHIFSCPDTPWVDDLKDMLMLGPTGFMVPAFLPYYADLVGRFDIKKLSAQLLKGGNIFSLDVKTKIVPKFLEGLVDPRPILQFEGPIYQLVGGWDVELKVGAVTDAVVVFHTYSPIAEVSLFVSRGYFTNDGEQRYHNLLVSPATEGQCHKKFALGSSIIVWNARHVARPSFVENFNKLVSLHNPLFMLVTETRVHKKGFMRVVEQLKNVLYWSVEESIGLGGGVALLWDKSRAMSSVDVVVHDDQETRMIAFIKPRCDVEDDTSDEYDEVDL